jgi:hypothetical protein
MLVTKGDIETHILMSSKKGMILKVEKNKLGLSNHYEFDAKWTELVLNCKILGTDTEWMNLPKGLIFKPKTESI